MEHPIRKIFASGRGIYSACTADRTVIRAVCERAAETGTTALIEATANQVNRFGGYTGYTPAAYFEMVNGIAAEAGLPADRLILGGDHLGPLTWQKLPEAEAMEKSRQLVSDFVLAGFTKIHLDTSMRVADDDMSARLPDAVIARRGAELAAVAERAFAERLKAEPCACHPVYCVGSEVPIPGGAQKEESGVDVTRAEDFSATVKAFKDAFEAAGVGAAWEHVVGVVVQPGVEFGDDTVVEYDSAAAAHLTAELRKYPNLVFEGHSTDYQTKLGLRSMVQDGIKILKVGPGLTFALREGLFALEQIERALLAGKPDVRLSRFAEVLDEAMLASPDNWAKYYRGSEEQRAFKRLYSFSDRCRYYLPFPSVREAEQRLLSNLSQIELPLSLLSQYMPMQYTLVREGKLSPKPEELLKSRVKNCIDEYLYAAEGD